MDHELQPLLGGSHDGYGGIDHEGGETLVRSATMIEWEKKEDQRKKGMKKLVASVVFCTLFMFTEVIGGILANSLAIMTDAAHLMSDMSSFFISICAINFARKAKTKKMTFGSGRAEILGAIISTVLIWVLTVWLLYEAVDRTIKIVRHEKLEVDGKLMTIIASCGIAVNLVMGIILGHDHGGHDHSHGGDGGHAHSHDIIGLIKASIRGSESGGHSHSHGGGGHDHSHGGGDGGHSHSHGGAPCGGHGGPPPPQESSHGHSHGGAPCGGHGSPPPPQESSHGHSHGGAPCGGHGDPPPSDFGEGGHSHSHGDQPCGGHGSPMMQQPDPYDDGGHGHSHGGAPCGGHGGGGGGHSHSHGGPPKKSLGNTLLLSRTLQGATFVELEKGAEAVMDECHRRHDDAANEPDQQHYYEPPPDLAELNVRAALIHVIGDFVQSIGVLIAAIIIWWRPEYKIADPVCTFLFSVLVLFTTIPVMKDSVMILLETVPGTIQPDALRSFIVRTPGVAECADLHCWSVSQGVGMLVAHVKLRPEAEANHYEVVDKIKQTLYEKYGLVHCTIEVDNDLLIKKQPCFFGFGY